MTEHRLQPLDDHSFLAHVTAGDQSLEVRVYANPELVERLGLAEEDAVRATLGFLLAHQEAQDLPQVLDLEDAAAAYPDFEDALRAGTDPQSGGRP